MIPKTPLIKLSKKSLFAINRLDHILEKAYHTPEADLDNKKDPLDEAIYIILSFQTNLEKFKKVWFQLKKAYPSWEYLNVAPLRQVAHVIQLGGLHLQKARNIKNLLKAIKSQNGDLSLKFLNSMQDPEVESYLTKLPGLSLKGARCIMLYSLHRNTFPVDGNTFRIFKRMGIVPSNSLYRRRVLHDSLQSAVNPSRRKAFHINLVIHGHRICHPLSPRCVECPILKFCPRSGVKAK